MAKFLHPDKIPDADVVLLYADEDKNNDVCHGFPGEVHNPAYTRDGNAQVPRTLAFTTAATSRAQVESFFEAHPNGRIVTGVSLDQFGNLARLPGNYESSGGDCGLGGHGNTAYQALYETPTKDS